MELMGSPDYERADRNERADMVLDVLLDRRTDLSPFRDDIRRSYVEGDVDLTEVVAPLVDRK